MGGDGFHEGCRRGVDWRTVLGRAGLASPVTSEGRLSKSGWKSGRVLRERGV